MSIEAMKQALEALEAAISDDKPYIGQGKEAITALREALAEQASEPDWKAEATALRVNEQNLLAKLAEQPAQKQEPVAWMWKDGTITSDPDRADGTWTPLYTSPQPNKPWVGLDQHDIDVLFLNEDGVRFARYIEAKLKEKNT